MPMSPRFLRPKAQDTIAIALDGSGNVIPPNTYTEGGIVYRSHVFNANGTLKILKSTLVDCLIVAGGGGGGPSDYGCAAGGGGGGGVRLFAQNATLGDYAVVVGGGGASNGNGGNSSVFGITATGGGAGRQTTAGASGGSGGGGGGEGVNSAGGAGVVAQGSAGGAARGDAATVNRAGGGGGGAGGVGVAGTTTKGGDGGPGITSTFANGTSITYAAGGGGGKTSFTGGTTAARGLGTANVSGDGGYNESNGLPGTANRGGGGGGAAQSSGGASPTLAGGAGGSGVVVVRYQIPDAELLPTQIPDLGIWLDGKDSSTFFETASGPATADGGPVGQWRDKSGNARHATNPMPATTSLRPTARYGYGLFFNGSNVLQTNGFSLGTSQRTIFVVCGPRTGGSGAHRILATRLNSVSDITVQTGTQTIQYYANQASQTISLGSAATTHANIIVARYQSASRMDLYLNSYSWGAHDPDDAYSGTVTFVLGAEGATYSTWGGEYREVIGYSRNLSEIEAASVIRYLQNKWSTAYFLPQYADADVNTYLAAVELADGRVLETPVRDAINTFITGCKTDGIWDAIKSSCILMGARTLAGALVPLRGAAPTNVNFVTADYNRKTGLVGDGTTKYLNANRLASADDGGSCHQSIYVTQLESRTFSNIMGYGGFTITGSKAMTTGNSVTTLSFYTANNGADNRSNGNSSVGYKGWTKAGTANTYRWNSANTAGTTNTAQVSPNVNYCVFATLDAAGALRGTSNQRASFYSFGSNVDLALLDSRVSALYTAIGAAIP